LPNNEVVIWNATDDEASLIKARFYDNPDIIQPREEAKLGADQDPKRSCLDELDEEEIVLGT